MKTKYTVAAIWVVSLLCSFFIGQLASRSPQTAATSENSPKPKKNRARSIPATSYGSNSSSIETRKQNILTASGANEAQYESTFAVEQVLSISNPVERSKVFHDLLDQLSLADFKTVYNAFLENGLSREHEDEYHKLIHQWALNDPQNALETIGETSLSKVGDYQTILAAWSSYNPTGALAWAEANHTNKNRPNSHLIGIIKGTVANDLNFATEQLTKLPYSAERGRALGFIMNELKKAPSDQFSSWVATIEDDRLRAGATKRAASILAERDPQEALEFIASLEAGDDRNSAIANLSSAWANKNLEEASKWVETLDGSEKQQATQSLIGTVAEQNIESAKNLLEANKDADNYQAILQSFISGSSKKDPFVALNHLDQVDKQDVKWQLGYRSIYRAARLDGEQTLEWLRNSDTFPEGQRNLMITRMERYLRRSQNDN